MCRNFGKKRPNSYSMYFPLEFWWSKSFRIRPIPISSFHDLFKMCAEKFEKQRINTQGFASFRLTKIEQQKTRHRSVQIRTFFNRSDRKCSKSSRSINHHKGIEKKKWSHRTIEKWRSSFQTGLEHVCLRQSNCKRANIANAFMAREKRRTLQNIWNASNRTANTTDIVAPLYVSFLWTANKRYIELFKVPLHVLKENLRMHCLFGWRVCVCVL